MAKRIAAFTALLVLPLILSVGFYKFFYSRDFKFSFNGVPRLYRLHLPASGDSTSKKPLLIALHGYGDRPWIMEAYTGLSRLADQQGFIIVYPYGTNSQGDKFLSWNAGPCCYSAMVAGTDDLGFINALTDNLISRYPIDPDKIYLIGYSNGAMMVHSLASQTPEKFAAASAISGSIAGESYPAFTPFSLPAPKRSFPIILFHGEKDLVVPFIGGVNVYSRQVGLAKFASYNDTLTYWANADSCSLPEITKPSSGVTLRKYSDCQTGDSVLGYSLSDRGHVWPGSLIEKFIYGNSQTIDAGETSWQFFQNYTRKP